MMQGSVRSCMILAVTQKDCVWKRGEERDNMPRPLVFAIGILLFAFATAFIYGWGIIKQHNQTRDLSRVLFSKGVDRVNRYLKTHDTITAREMEGLVKGMRASLFYSRNQAVVMDPKDFVRQLTAYMTEYHLLVEERSGKETVYRKNKL